MPLNVAVCVRRLPLSAVIEPPPVGRSDGEIGGMHLSGRGLERLSRQHNGASWRCRGSGSH